MTCPPCTHDCDQGRKCSSRPRHPGGRPVVAPKCRGCGEKDERRFDAGYKRLCTGCRLYNERIRYWHRRGKHLDMRPV